MAGAGAGAGAGAAAGAGARARARAISSKNFSSSCIGFVHPGWSQVART